MSSAARFLLEFEATGDQEVVAKIREVGAAGKQTATDLQALQGVQDPFAEVASGAESAVTPIEGVGTAATETTGTLTELTTEGEAAGTGMTDLGASTEEAASKTEGFGSSIATMSGSLAAVGGTIGSVISSLFRYQDIQLKVQKAQLTSARATEMSRKAEEGLDKVLATATGNTANIAAARDRLAKAQVNMNKLMDQGVTSGSAFEAAQNEVAAAQKNLSAEFAKGGGDISKLTTAMEKSEINSSKMVVSLNNLEKANREAQQGTLDLAFGFTGMAGSIVQTISGLGNLQKSAIALTGKIGGWPGLLAKIGGGFGTVLLGLRGIATFATATLLPVMGAVVLAAAAVLTAYEGFRGIPKIFDFVNASIEGNLKTMMDAGIQMLELLKNIQKFSPTGAAVTPMLDEAIKKLKEVAAARKISIDTVEQEKSAQSGLGQILDQIPQKYKDMINEALGMDLIPPTTQFATDSLNTFTQASNSAAVEAENTAAGIGKIAPAAASATSAIYDQTNSLANLGTVEQETAKAMEDGVVTEIEFQRIRAATIKTTKDAINSGGQLTDSIKEQMSASEGMVQSAASVEQELQNMGIGMVNVATNSAQVETEISSLGGELAILRGTSAGAEIEMNNLGTAVGDLRPAFDDAKKAANENAEANNTNAQVILGMIGSIEQEQEALSEVNLAYAESEKKLADLNTVLNDAGAHHKAVKTAVNEAAAAVLEEKIALEAAAAVASDAGIQIQKVANAYLEGATSIAEWRNELEQTKAAQQGQIDGLAAMGLNFDKLADASGGSLPPTIDNLKLLGAALDGTAEDSQAWLDALSEAFANIQAAGNEMVAGLADAINKGGEDMNDITDKWLEDMPEQFRERLDESQIVAMEGMAELQALAKANKFELEADFKTESLDKARSDFIGNLQQMRSEAKPEFKGIYDEAIKIAEKGTADQMHRVAEILASDDPWPVMLEKLRQIKLEQEGKRLGTDFTTGMVNGIQQGSGAVETELQGIQDQFITAFGKEKLAQEPIKITADVSQAAQAIGSIQNTLRTMVAAPIKITADVQQAGSAIASIVKTLSTLTAPPIVVTANTTQAVSALNAASNAALTMRNNFNAASSGVKSAAAGAGAAVASFSSKASSSFAKAGAAGTQMANKVKSASNSMKSSLNSAASSAASFASKCVSSFNKVGSSASSNASRVRQLASAINSLRSKSITVHVGLSGPGVRFLQHGFHGVVNEPMLFIAGEAGPERVDVTPGVSRGSEGGGARGHQNIVRSITAGGGGGGSREVVIPVTLMLDNKVLIRTVRRGLVEEVSGAM